MNDRKHIFISYSSRNKQFVDSLRQDLQKAGLNIWIDKEGLTAGTPNWERALREAIRGSYALVLVASPDAYESRYVQGEIEVSKMYSCPIYPVWAIGEIWGDCVPMDMIKMQYADMRESKYSVGLSQVVDQLHQITPQSTSTEEPSQTKSVPDGFVPRNPYKGLRAFTQADQSDFFGRNALVSQLVDTLQDSDFLTVVGPSGSGKSSLVMAGLIPKLQAEAIPGSENWIYLDPVMPGSNPIEAIAIALSDEMDSSISPIIEDLEYGPRGLQLQLRKLSRKRGTKIVLFIDQFEEIFTQTSDPNLRSQFVDLITEAVASGSNCKVITTLRADFYDRPMNHRKLAELMEKHSKSVLPLSLEELRQVIEEPAIQNDVRLEFDHNLIGDLLYEVSGENGALPLLQFTLDQLFRQRNGLTLTRTSYQQIGGLKGALAAHAETTYLELPTDLHRAMARTLFLRLIEPGSNEQETTRRRARISELATENSDISNILQETATIFVSARLLMTRENSIEVSHEALIREWKRLSNWIYEAHEDIKIQQNLRINTLEWIDRGRRSDDLYRGSRLREAASWSRRNLASKEEEEFIQASSDAEKSLAEMEKQRVIEVFEQERASIVRSLHDVPVQMIGAIAMRLRVLPKLLDEDRKLAFQEIIQVMEMAQQASDSLRHIMLDLRPPDDSASLLSAITKLSETTKSTYKQEVVVEADRSIDVVLNETTKAMLFYAIESALTNARKFAKSDLITITAKHMEDVVEVRITDFGIGFDVESTRTQYGFYNMKARADSMGGTFNVHSGPQKGTTVTFVVPTQDARTKM